MYRSALSLCNVVSEHDYHYHCSIVRLVWQEYTLYFRRVDTDYNKGYAVLTLVDTRYTKDYKVFMFMVTAYTKHYAVLSGGGYYLYYVLRSINKNEAKEK